MGRLVMKMGGLEIKRLLEVTLYLFLLMPALYFVHKYFAEYYEGKTFFIETHEPLTFGDLPTVIYCYDYDSMAGRRTEYSNLTEEEKVEFHSGAFFEGLSLDVWWPGIDGLPWPQTRPGPFAGRPHTLTLKNNSLQGSGLKISLDQLWTKYVP